MFPQYFQLELLVSSLLFLEDLLYCIQIHIWKRLPQAKSNFIVAFWLLSPTEEILRTQPTNLSSPDTWSQDGKPDLRGWQTNAATTGLFSSKRTVKTVNKQGMPDTITYLTGGIHVKNHPAHRYTRQMTNTIFYVAGSVSSHISPAHGHQQD